MGLSNNDVLKKLRYALNFNDNKMKEIFELEGGNISLNEVSAYLSKEEETSYRECTDKNLEYFLNGLITYRRGKKDTGYKTGKVLMPKEKSTD
ncbi:MAG: DUF1456 family protein [Spirochaetaceae bacterium]|jgi:uncharacterized protein YehS (DUF1456 family)|nr:DUF1456 family protein [Spirochaetaceae bacterium]